MLNNRLEDLIIIYKNYQIKLFIRRVIIGIIFILLFLSMYLIYETSKNIYRSNLKQKDNRTKVNKTPPIVKKVVRVIKIKEPTKIDEDQLFNKNVLTTLLSVEKRKPSYNSAIDIAKYYFKDKKYKKSAKWALIATNRKPQNDEAWLIYAKSKIKLNQKDIAKKALKIYLLKYYSQKVVNLLNSL